jgi:hypothetical protein
MIYLMKKFYMLKFSSPGRCTSMVHPGAGAGTKAELVVAKFENQ